MKKIKAFLTALLLCTSITGCSSSNVNTASETTVDTIVSETSSTIETTTAETTTEPEITTLTETTTEETTTEETTPAETAETAEDGKLVSPSGWVLDKKVLVSDYTNYSLSEIEKPVFITELSDGSNIYGVCIDGLVDENGEKLFAQYTIIEHDGIADEFERACFGRFACDSPVECSLFNMDDDDDREIFSTVYTAGGTMCAIYDIAVFDKNESGHYEMLTVDEPSEDSIFGFGSNEDAFAEEMISKINAEWADDNGTVRFFTDTYECTAILDKELFGEYTNDDIKENLSYINSLKKYSLEGDTLYLEITLNVHNPNMIMPEAICTAKGELIYSDGSFTLGNVILDTEW